MTQQELLELALKLLEDVDVNFIDDVEVTVRKTDDGKQRVVVDITYDS